MKVIRKHEIRKFTNAKGNGVILNVDLLDASNTEIRAVCFNEAVHKFEPILDERKIYLMSDGLVRLANKKYTSNPNDYELTFGPYADIQVAAN